MKTEVQKKAERKEALAKAIGLIKAIMNDFDADGEIATADKVMEAGFLLQEAYDSCPEYWEIAPGVREY